MQSNVQAHNSQQNTDRLIRYLLLKMIVIQTEVILPSLIQYTVVRNHPLKAIVNLHEDAYGESAQISQRQHRVLK